MSDLVDRLEKIAKHAVHTVGEKPFLLSLDDGIALHEAIEIIKQRQWIPVTERLPEEERKHYWICTDTGYQCECRWTNNRFGIAESDEWGWSIFDVPQYSHVVAWMPLPEPYRGGGEECH